MLMIKNPFSEEVLVNQLHGFPQGGPLEKKFNNILKLKRLLAKLSMHKMKKAKKLKVKNKLKLFKMFSLLRK